MSVAFEQTIYLQAIKKERGFSDERTILHHVKQGLQFKYGAVSQEKFNEKYSAKGWSMRKAVALPAAAWAGSAQLVYHLAKAIFAGIPKAFSDQGIYLKVQIFNIARDVQEVYGRISSLFNDRYGRFHVQESRFQRTYYENFIRETQLGSNASSSSEVGEVSYRSSSSSSSSSSFLSSEKIFAEFFRYNVQPASISLLNYKDKAPEERKELAKRFNFQISFELLGSKRSLDEFVDQAGEEILKALTLEDLIIPFEQSKLKFALLGKEEFNALTLEEFQGEMTVDQISFVKKRLKENSKSEKMESQPKNLATYEDKTKILLKDLIRFRSDDIFEHRESIPDVAFNFLTNDQLKSLKISQMRFAQNKALFSALNKEERKERLAIFEKEDLIDAIRKALIPGSILKILRNEHLKYVHLSNLSKDTIEEIFPHSFDNRSDQERFANFDAYVVREALIAGLIRGDYRLSLLSDDQLKLVPLSQLSKNMIYEMFPDSPDNKNDLKRFANFNPNEVQSAFENYKLNQYQIGLISIEQLREFAFSCMPQNLVNMLFPPYSIDVLREKHSHWSSSSVMRNGVVLQNERVLKYHYSDEVLKKMSKDQQQKNEERLAQLSQKQREDLEPLLYQKKVFSKSSKR